MAISDAEIDRARFQYFEIRIGPDGSLTKPDGLLGEVIAQGTRSDAVSRSVRPLSDAIRGSIDLDPRADLRKARTFAYTMVQHAHDRQDVRTGRAVERGAIAPNPSLHIRPREHPDNSSPTSK